MPGFGDAFSGLSLDRKMTADELVRAVRFAVAAEYEAVQQYTQIAEASDNPLVTKVMLEIADEERVHAGEFLRLLREIAPEEAGLYEEGGSEVEDAAGGEAKAKPRGASAWPQVGAKVTPRERTEAYYSGYAGAPECFLEPGEVAIVVSVDNPPVTGRRANFLTAAFERGGRRWTVALRRGEYDVVKDAGERAARRIARRLVAKQA